MDNNLRLAVQALLLTPDLAGLGPESRPGARPIPELESTLGPLLTSLPPSTQQLVPSLVLLWHDHLEASHEISQNCSGAAGSYLHGLMHRREPDYGNARYWFARVGPHPVFGSLAEEAVRLNDSFDYTRFIKPMVRQRQWNPSAFIDACVDAIETGNTTQVAWLQQLQAAEFRLLLDEILG